MPIAIECISSCIYINFTAATLKLQRIITFFVNVGDGSLTGRKAIDNGKVEPGFLCSNGTILDLVQLCDGMADCEGGDDETYPLCASKPFIG